MQTYCTCASNSGYLIQYDNMKKLSKFSPNLHKNNITKIMFDKMCLNSLTKEVKVTRSN